MTTEFTALGLQPQLAQVVADLGYTTPTPIQSAVIPLMLSGQDVIGQAQTGTGKTAAFALPILQNLIPKERHVQSLVLAPTRELAMQVAQAITQYGRGSRVSVLAVYGGQSYAKQIGRLRKGVDVVVGTPGRLLDLIKQKYLDLSEVHTVVLDEADEMLSMGFIEDIEAILGQTPEDRQTALFSATMPAAIRRLADQYMNAPQSVTIKHKRLTVDSVEQRYYLVNEFDKLAALTRLFEVEEVTSAIVFMRTRVSTGSIANQLSTRGFSAEALNGDLSQEARTRVLHRFRKGQIKVLVATDVAARGLDIDDISHIFNFDLPQDPEAYVHRIGRTGRAGRTGIAISLVTPKEKWQLHRIEGYTKHKIKQAELPTVAEIEEHREMVLKQQMQSLLNGHIHQREQRIVAELVEHGHDLLEVAAVALKLASAEESHRPIESISPVRGFGAKKSKRDRYGDRRNGYSNGRRNNRRDSRQNGRYEKRSNGRNGNGSSKISHEQGMVRLSINHGKAHGVRPNDVVSTLAYFANIPGHSIGKIRVQDQQTLVDVPESFVEQVLANTGSYKIRKQNVKIQRAS